MTEKEVKNGFLYIVTNSFLAESRKLNRRVLVEVGEVIEFRYFSPVHFRTRDDLYLSCAKDYFLKNTEAYGEIWDNVRFRNQNTLKQILECKLYNKIKGE